MQLLNRLSSVAVVAGDALPRLNIQLLNLLVSLAVKAGDNVHALKMKL